MSGQSPFIRPIGYLSLLMGVAAALYFGGRDVIRHATLRLLLWLTNTVPLNLPRFFDYAATHLQILQKVGAGYIFVHRMMKEYFASLDDPGTTSG